MPNTKSAERRARNSVRKHQHNTVIKARLKTLEKKYRSLVSAGNRDEAASALRAASSAFDKAAGSGVIHKRKADRKKSRLALVLGGAK
ncbi:MAG: 30S ribosomal protein S20 [Limisphaerales bacterium]